jgi:flagellar biosynthesis protein
MSARYGIGNYQGEAAQPATGSAPSANPSPAHHPGLAIALHYRGRGAPRITAKGGGEVAQKIIDTARQHNVPLQEDAALAHALSHVELGREIPRELWVAVAQVLAFAWTVAGKKK